MGLKLLSDILSVVQTLLEGYQKIEGDGGGGGGGDTSKKKPSGSVIDDLVNLLPTTTTTTTEDPFNNNGGDDNPTKMAWIGFLLFLAFDLLICCCVLCALGLGVAAFVCYFRRNGSPLTDRRERRAKGGRVIKEGDSGSSGESGDRGGEERGSKA